LSFLSPGIKRFVVMRRDIRPKTSEALADYYYRTYRHLLGDILIIELDTASRNVRILNEPNSHQLAKTWPFPRYAAYEKELRKIATEWFDAKDLPRDSNYSFILDKRERWPLNMVLPEVAEYIQRCKAECETAGKSFPLHKYLHHGLSSQAMAFNLVGPLIVRNDYQPLIDALGTVGVECEEGLHDAVFEFENRQVFNEDSGQPTSIDIVLRDNDSQPFVFIESKLMEREFGGCSVLAAGDCSGENPLGDKSRCYLHHIGRKYWTLAEKYGISELTSDEGLCILATYYQFFRELLFALEYGGIFVLLHDERSPVFHCEANGVNQGLMPMLLKYVPEEYHSRVGSISIQRLSEHIAESEKHQDWIGDFRKKYGIG
jgi:hypothetical protein